MNNKLLNQLKLQNSDLTLSEIEGILHILFKQRDLTNTKLISLTGLPKETLRKFKKSVAFLLTLPSADEISLTNEGKRLIEKIVPRVHKWCVLDAECDTVLLEKFSRLRAQFVPAPKRGYDQFLATPQTSLAKARILLDKGVVARKNIAFLGDDDFVAIALALLTESYASIKVFDIDADVVEAINRITLELGLESVSAEVYDAGKIIRKTDFGRFDVIVTDPPYTLAGARLFLKRSLEFLGYVRNFAGKYLFLYFGGSFKSPEKFLELQKIINACNLVIEDKIHNFCRYEGAESIGGSSDLYVLKVTPKAVLFSEEVLENIYTA